jgi:hypothetical protein
VTSVSAHNSGGGNFLVGPPNSDQTIILIRHGEKPSSHPSGQLDCQGLNRALALPAVLAKYGRPVAIFAANPSEQNSEGNPFGPKYSYVRPLATIEPYAVSLGMPVNAQIGYTALKQLENELVKPEYAHGVVVVSWEHIKAWEMTEDILAAFGQDVTQAARWKDSDYDMIYVFHFTSGPDGKRKLQFRIDQQNLNKLPTTCPGAQGTASVSAGM